MLSLRVYLDLLPRSGNVTHQPIEHLPQSALGAEVMLRHACEVLRAIWDIIAHTWRFEWSERSPKLDILKSGGF